MALIINNVTSNQLDYLELDLLDSETGRELSIFHSLILTAKKSNIEDVYVCVRDDSFIQSFQAKKKKLLNKINLTVIIVPPQVQTQLDLIRLVETTVGTAGLSKGFFFVSSHILLPKAINQLAEFHRSVAKKDSSALLSFWPIHTAPRSYTSIPSQRRICVLDGKTSELLATGSFNLYKTKTLDLPSLLPLHGRWQNPPEQISVRTDLRLSDFFYATGELLKLMSENFDFASILDVVENALAREVKLEGIYVYDKELRPFSKCQSPVQEIKLPADILSYRSLSEFCKFDSHLDSDAIHNEGVRSSWKTNEENAVYHETVELGANSTFSDCLVLKNVKIGPRSQLKKSVVVLEGTTIGPDCDISGPIIVKSNTSLPANTVLKGPGFVRSTSGDVSPKFEFVSCELDALDSLPNQEWVDLVQDLNNDPSRDPDSLLDALYDDDESSSSGSEDEDDTKEFSRECQSMIMSVVRNPEHLRNIELELRSYRLSAFKSDALVLTSILPIMLAAIVLRNPSTVTASQEYVEASGIGDIFRGFFDGTHDPVYDAIKQIVVHRAKIPDLTHDNDDPEKTVENPALGKADWFCKLCASFDEDMDHQQFFSRWLGSQTDDFFKHPQILKYEQWIAEEDDDDDSE